MSRHLLGALLALAAALPPCAGAQSWAPNKTVELIVFSAPGGGNDKGARYLHKIWTERKMLDAVVVNKVGGGGALAYTYVSQKIGDPTHIAIAQAGLLTNQIAGRSPLTLGDFTVLPYIGTEPIVLAVRADSPYKTLKDFMAQLKKDPASLSISTGSTRGGTNHFTAALLAKAVGVDPKQLKILVFGGGAESVTNLLGGHIDAMMQASNNAIPHARAGTMRILGISTAARSPSIPQAPTFKEQGFDVALDGWYIFIGPKNMTAPQVAYWDDVFARTVKTEEWKQFLESTGWDYGYKNSRDNAAYIKSEYEVARSLLTELGMAAKPQ
jgi:putative tricarboxylic transport membrane protein